MQPNWFQSDPMRLPDAEFEAGELRHLCVGNTGRLMDFRRTPVRVTALSHSTGLATIEITQFEDQGAFWDLPYEDVTSYQFVRGCATAPEGELEKMRAAIARFDVMTTISCDAAKRASTLLAITEARAHATVWLKEHSRFLRSGRALPEGKPEGDAFLFADVAEYMRMSGLHDLEAHLPRRYVSNMNNETVKVLRMAVARMGLAPYQGKVIRDPAQADAEFSLERRARYVVARMGFLQALLEQCGREKVVLYRMESRQGLLRSRRGGTALVSASFRMDIVQEMSGWADPLRTVAIYRQAVPVDRLLMTYLETEAMNHPYREAEALLLAEPDNVMF